MKRKPVLIMGPTASGKSALALSLAKSRDGEVINADSAQVYADWQVLSARPTLAEMEGIPHHLYGHVDGAVRYSTGAWLRAVMELIRDIQARGRLPILVGGTGLYFRALTQGLADIPPIAPDIKAMVADQIDAVGPPAMHADLALIDPAAAARINPNDGIRIARAMGVFLSCGETISSLQANTVPILGDRAFVGVALLPERAANYQAVAQRFRLMLDHGAIEEAQQVLARKLDDTLPVMKALGAPPLFAFLRGEIDRQDVHARAVLDTCHYVKRQATWVRNTAADYHQITDMTLQGRLEVIHSLLEAY